MTEGLLLFGAGGFGRSVADAAHSQGVLRVAGFIDDRGPELGPVLGHPVIGRLSDLKALRGDFDFISICIGDNARRREVARLTQALGYRLATVIHPRAIVSTHARIGAGSLVMAGSIVGAEASVGMGVIVNAGAVVDHHAEVGDYAHLGIGALMAGGAVLPELARLGEGEVLLAGARRTS